MNRNVSRISGPDDFFRKFDVSRETISRLENYVKLLLKWQKAVNLVGNSTLDDIWHRHIADSAQLVNIVNMSDSPVRPSIWLDIGSGGGFPGLVVASMMADKTDMHFHLVESNARKCAFLSEVVRRLSLAVRVHNCRIEQCASIPALQHLDYVSARALASTERLLELIEPLLHKKLVALFPKGDNVERELEQARKNWQFELVQHQSRSSVQGQVLEMRQIARV